MGSQRNTAFGKAPDRPPSPAVLQDHRTECRAEAEAEQRAMERERAHANRPCGPRPRQPRLGRRVDRVGTWSRWQRCAV